MLNIHTPLTLFFFGLAICFVTSGIYHEGKTVCLWHASVQTMNDVFFALFVAQNIYVTEKLFQQEVSPTLDQAFRATFVMFLLPMALVILNANQLILYTCVLGNMVVFYRAQNLPMETVVVMTTNPMLRTMVAQIEREDEV